jgi:hypothetical protein
MLFSSHENIVKDLLTFHDTACALRDFASREPKSMTVREALIKSFDSLRIYAP